MLPEIRQAMKSYPIRSHAQYLPRLSKHFLQQWPVDYPGILILGNSDDCHILQNAGDNKTNLVYSGTEASRRLLIVEDEAIVALDIRMTLTRIGYEIIATVGSGNEALHHINTLKPDLILMDIQLSDDIDGIQVAEHIRANFDIPVIFLTGQADTATMERAQKVEPAAILLKPFTKFDLQNTIQMVLEKHGSKQ